MAAIAVPAVVGAAAAVGSKLVHPSTFVSRHEGDYRTEAAEIDKQTDNWHTIPAEDVSSDEEKEFNNRRDAQVYVLQVIFDPRLISDLTEQESAEKIIRTRSQNTRRYPGWDLPRKK